MFKIHFCWNFILQLYHDIIKLVYFILWFWIHLFCYRKFMNYLFIVWRNCSNWIVIMSEFHLFCLEHICVTSTSEFHLFSLEHICVTSTVLCQKSFPVHIKPWFFFKLLPSHFVLNFYEIFSITSRNKHSFCVFSFRIILFLLFLKTWFKHKI
jgi:hypothetical protein